MTVCAAPGEILSFWGESGPDKWFEQDETFDQAITLRFLPTYETAKNSELAIWEDSVEGALALILVLDQFPRNLFRGDARAFATDELARAVAERVLARGFDQATDLALRPFFYLPFMHSEALIDQDRSVRLYEALGETKELRYATEHRDVVLRFARFPHRNRALGRDTTPAEQAFLEADGFAGSKDHDL